MTPRNPEEPAFDGDLTRSGDAIPSPFSGDRAWPGALPVVHPHAAGDRGPDHRLAHLESTAHDRDLVWRADRPVTVLHLHGLGEIALDGGLGDPVAGHPQPADRRALAPGVGRFAQPEDRAQGVWLSADL